MTENIAKFMPGNLKAAARSAAHEAPADRPEPASRLQRPASANGTALFPDMFLQRSEAAVTSAVQLLQRYGHCLEFGLFLSTWLVRLMEHCGTARTGESLQSQGTMFMVNTDRPAAATQ
jgi:hypothetical protein